MGLFASEVRRSAQRAPRRQYVNAGGGLITGISPVKYNHTQRAQFTHASHLVPSDPPPFFFSSSVAFLHCGQLPLIFLSFAGIV